MAPEVTPRHEAWTPLLSIGLTRIAAGRLVAYNPPAQPIPSTMRLSLFAPLALAATAAVAAAQTPVDSQLFRGMEWRTIGPNRGGRSIAVAGSAARPLEYYFGATGGGLWKSVDGGTTWRPVTDGQITTSSVGAVAVSPSNPDVVYIGTGESEIRGNIAPGDGVYKSTDAGKTWTHIGLVEAQNISKIRVHPTNPDVVFVAAFGHHAVPNPERGI